MKNSGIIKFPNTRRKLSKEEEKLVHVCANMIHNEYVNTNPFVKPKQKLSRSETSLKELIHDIFELNED
jgi:hypothetical protein